MLEEAQMSVEESFDDGRIPLSKTGDILPAIQRGNTITTNAIYRVRGLLSESNAVCKQSQ